MMHKPRTGRFREVVVDRQRAAREAAVAGDHECTRPQARVRWKQSTPEVVLLARGDSSVTPSRLALDLVVCSKELKKKYVTVLAYDRCVQLISRVRTRSRRRTQ